MDYKVISADSHVDMTWLPGDLFVSEASAKWKDKVPKVVETDQGSRWFAEGHELGAVGGMGASFMAPARGFSKTVDRMLDTGFYDDGAKGMPHPTTPELRLKDMVLDGVDAEVVYGILHTAEHLQDRDLVTEVYRIYNDWIGDFCETHPGRWAGLACIPNHDPQVAAAEIRRAAGLGLKGIDFDIASATLDIWDRAWDPLWEALQETDIPVSFHGTGPRGYPYRTTGNKWNDMIYSGIRMTIFQISASEFLAAIILSGAPDRYPGLNFILGEAGVGWVPYTIERMDLEYEDRMDHLSMMPSEFWKRQGYTTFQTESTGPHLVDMIGENNILWGSDYPHPDGVWPNSQEAIQNDLGHLNEKVRKKITRDNAARLYGFN